MATFRGTSKRDILRAGTSGDTLLGLGGHDDLYGNGGNDTIKGGAGNDKLLGGKGRDTLKGETGNDTLNGGSGNDTLIGGSGTDTAVLATSWLGAGITQSGSSFVIAGPLANGTDTVTGVEKFKFTNGTFTAAQILNDAPTGGTGGIYVTTVGTPLILTSVSAFLASFSDADTPLGDTLSIQGITGGGDLFVSNGNLVHGGLVVSVPINYTVTIADSKGATAAVVFSLETIPNQAPAIADLTSTETQVGFVVNDPDSTTATLAGVKGVVAGDDYVIV